MANICYQKQEYKKAEKAYLEILKAFKHLSGKDNQLTLAIKMKLGSINRHKNNYSQSHAYFIEASSTISSIQGSHSFLNVGLKSEQAYLLEAEERYPEALETIEYAIKLVSEMYGAQHSSVIELRERQEKI